MDRSQFQSLAAVASRQDGIPKGLEEILFAVQYLLVIVDAKNNSASSFRISRQEHGSLPRPIFHTWVQESVQNCSTCFWGTVENHPPAERQRLTCFADSLRNAQSHLDDAIWFLRGLAWKNS